MGKGNVCTTGKYEGLYYVDNDYLHVYRRDDPEADEPETRLMCDLDYGEITGGEWVFDEYGTMEEEGDVEECFIDAFTSRFPSFHRPSEDLWVGYNRSRHVILENGLFYICVEDNEWSLAYELIQKEEPWGDQWMENLQHRFYDSYLEGMKRALLDRLPEIGGYSGAWTSYTIRREDIAS